MAPLPAVSSQPAATSRLWVSPPREGIAQESVAGRHPLHWTPVLASPRLGPAGGLEDESIRQPRTASRRRRPMTTGLKGAPDCTHPGCYKKIYRRGDDGEPYCPKHYRERETAEME